VTALIKPTGVYTVAGGWVRAPPTVVQPNGGGRGGGPFGPEAAVWENVGDGEQSLN